VFDIKSSRWEDVLLVTMGLGFPQSEVVAFVISVKGDKLNCYHQIDTANNRKYTPIS
jgi:hypothetical protein